jgi:hypothetical protein
MRYFIIFVSSLFLVLAIIPLVASSTQQEVCERVVQTALEEANQVCTGTERNQACYGHMNLEAQPQSRVEPFKFDQAGDIVNVTQLKSLRLSPMNVATGTWGVAMLSLQANLSEDIPSQNVTLVLFGDVQVDNAIDIPTEMDIAVSSLGNANVRREPSDTGFVLGTLAPQQIVTAMGRNADSSWLYIDYPGLDEHGWINTHLIDASGEVDNLNVINPELIEYGPMQAFYVRTGDNSSTCEEAPNDGLLIQTPEGAGEVRLWINEVKIRLGSTVYIQAQPSGKMTISTLEGAAHVEAFGVEQTAIAGTTVTVDLDANAKAVAPPNLPERYTEETVNHLPVENLDEQITVVSPVSLTPPTADTMTATDAPTEHPTQTATDMPTAIPTDTPTVTPTDTSLPPTETSTDIPTQIPPTDDPGTARTEEATEEVSQTQEPPSGSSGNDAPSETPPPNETPSDDSRPTEAATDEPTLEGLQSSNSTNPGSQSESGSFAQFSEATLEPSP